MAKGGFGAYSSVPRSSGMGQGAAQVVNPVAPIATDFTGLNQGIQNLGAGVMDMKAQDAAKKKAEAQKLKDAQDLNAGTTPYYQNAFNAHKDKVMQGVLNSEDENIDLDKVAADLGRFGKDIEAAEKLEVSMLKQAQQDENQMVRDANGNWIPFQEVMFDRLATAPTEEELALADEGLFAQNRMLELNDLQKSTLKRDPLYDPEFKISDTFMDYAKNSASSKAVIQKVMNDNDGNYDFKKVITELPLEERKKFIDKVKDSDQLMTEWVTQRAIATNQKIPNINDPNERALIEDAWYEEVDKIDSRLPATRKESGSVVKSVDGQQRGNNKQTDQYRVIELENENFATPKDFENQVEKVGSLISKSNSEDFTEDDAKLLKESQNLLKKMKSTSWGFDTESAKTTSLVNDKTPDKEIPVSIGNYTGGLKSITVDKNGKGYAVINTKVSYRKGSTADDGTATSRTIIQPLPVEISPNDVKMIEERYNVKVMPDGSVEETTTEDFNWGDQ